MDYVTIQQRYLVEEPCAMFSIIGYLLRRVTWPQDVTSADTISEYVSYIKRRYCNATIVFDGYDSGPSTKDVTHNRRSGRVAPDIDFSENMRVGLCLKVEPFLSNGANKQRLIIIFDSRVAWRWLWSNPGL